MTDPNRSALRAATRSARLLSLLATVGLGLGLVLGPRAAEAAPGVSVGGQVGTQGAQGSASSSGRKAGYKWPERVVAGNAISLLLPVQVGFVGYLPRVRIGFQYERQLLKAHWVYIGVAGLFDRAGWENFRLDECGLDSATGVCNRGTVAGFDVYAGYAHKWFLRDRPWLVPIARGALGGGWWKYPDVGGGSRQQVRESTWTLNLRGGGGLRVFPIANLGLGVDVNVVLGLTRSTDAPLAAPRTKSGKFLLGMELLPLVVEYRF